ncbi:ASCH domain-containing protein [Kitasatospora aureofaciens]|uniref:ASCH domain-containing protein n=1 Tax=Kitasatospora aureofaciens TaxID=1894 RepID=UPI001C47DA50|nr:ASCH domain-containing protein [Kitasatospora aureofaciens]MBV6699683.1 ASCH domain-containing protein [Kitasatospora aureofaciens]
MPEQDRVIQIRRPYLDLIADGTKTIEVRVGYPSMRRIHPGQALVFESGGARCRTQVVKVAEYSTFEAMFDAEDNEAIGSEGMNRDELLSACREIYPPEKEALGVLAIHLRLAPAPADDRGGEQAAARAEI